LVVDDAPVKNTVPPFGLKVAAAGAKEPTTFVVTEEARSVPSLIPAFRFSVPAVPLIVPVALVIVLEKVVVPVPQLIVPVFVTAPVNVDAVAIDSVPLFVVVPVTERSFPAPVIERLRPVLAVVRLSRGRR
jgi:hypothetical protein